ncbi:aspartate aminotransferase family protein [Streptomyces carpinensis]|uniref:Aminotransferase class III-fold pyridoxal phosphate-dependent enzyme n=1 Tax=Streptomyces carpinensis TaxID=66369 RepID=A0ABV1W0B7_9ACTN|nr:aminotransferase class III-fold pyridoxal phosphate-dependent enzyme [Streptomyces carpinensis]
MISESNVVDGPHDAHARRNANGRPILPGGYGRSAYHVGRTPTYAVRGEGWRLWDDSGRELIDANGNFTTLIHGNAHPEIVEAAGRAISQGSAWGIPNLPEWDLAEAMISRLRGLGQIRFTNSGTEAVMSAIRIARAATGRDGIVMTKDGYHGSSDTVLLTSGPSRGVPSAVEKDVSLVPLNDIDELRRVFEASDETVAAIILDLLPNKAGLVGVDQQFAAEARALATKHGALLIIDEVISLRLSVGGLSGIYGIVPDLLTAGKVIGGGFAIGAVAGRDEVMDILDPWKPGSLAHSGTFSGNPVSVAAGAAALRLLTAEEIDRINALGDTARERASKELEPFGWEVRGRGSLFRAFPKGARKVAADLQQALWWAAYDRGVVLSSANLAALSTPMDASVVEDLTDRLIDAVAHVSAATS